MSDVAETGKKGGWLSRLRDGLAKSTKRVTESITGLFTKKKLDQATLNDLEDALIQADLGVGVAARLVEKLGKERFGKEVTDEEVRAAFADDIAEILQPVAVPLAIDAAHKPHVVLVVGVNGSGKTTTIAKLAHLLKGEGRKVMLAAGDTFRAAAIEQLRVWAERARAQFVATRTGGDHAEPTMTNSISTNAPPEVPKWRGHTQGRSLVLRSRLTSKVIELTTVSRSTRCSFTRSSR